MVSPQNGYAAAGRGGRARAPRRAVPVSGSFAPCTRPPVPAGRDYLVADILDLYTPRNLYALHAIGAKIESDSSFGNQFARVVAPITGVKSDRYNPQDRHQVDMITGATISSRAVIRIISDALTQVGPLIDSYQEKGKP